MKVKKEKIQAINRLMHLSKLNIYSLLFQKVYHYFRFENLYFLIQDCYYISQKYQTNNDSKYLEQRKIQTMNHIQPDIFLNHILIPL
jgi:hypothetical protein